MSGTKGKPPPEMPKDNNRPIRHNREDGNIDFGECPDPRETPTIIIEHPTRPPPPKK